MLKVSTLLSRIRDIKSGQREIDVRKGICENIGIRMFPDKLLNSWEKYSTDYLFPVPSGKEGVSAEEMYLKTASAEGGNLWDKNTKYGQLRYEFLDFVEQYVQDCTAYVVNPYGVYDYEDTPDELEDHEILLIVKESLVPEGQLAVDILSEAYDQGKNLLGLPCVIRQGFF